MTTKNLLSHQSDYNVEIVELRPPKDNFLEEKLPTLKDVIGLVRFEIDINKFSGNEAIRRISEVVHIHWIAQNVYPARDRS